MEETIGYEELLSENEWDSLDTGEWSYDDIDLDSSPSGVAMMNGDGRAAPSQTVASEGNNSPDIGPRASAATPADVRPESEKQEPSMVVLGLVHEVSCWTRGLVDGTTEYVLECEVCEEIGTADDYEEADAITQLHRTFVVELVATWE